MKNTLYLLLFLFVFILVGMTGCASSPARAPETARVRSTVSDKETKPTFSEKVTAVEADQSGSKVACPRDGAWNGLDWRKILPMVNACAKNKDWVKVDAVGAYLGVHSSETPWGAYYMGLSAGARKDYPRAVWMLELALKKAPQEGLLHYELGRIYWELGDDAAALKSLKLASDLNPSLTDAHWVMGQIALQRGDAGEAETLLLKALSNNPGHLPALMALASMKTRAKDWPAAETYLQRALKLNPRDANVKVALGEVQQQLKTQASDQKISSRKPTAEKEKKVSQ